MPKIYQRYAKDIPGIFQRLQIQDNNLKKIYAKDVPGVQTKNSEQPCRPVAGGLSSIISI